MTRWPTINCLTKIALTLGFAFAGARAYGEISNTEAKKTVRWILNEHREDLKRHPLPLFFEFDERRESKGMFEFLFIAYSAHVHPEERVLRTGAPKTTVNVMKFSGYFPALPGMTTDIFALIACHELGHVIGGAPKASIFKEFPQASHSIEGQADYYAASKCFKRYIKAHPVARLNVEPGTWGLCAQQFKTAADIQACARTIMVGEGLLNTIRPKDASNSKDVRFTTSLLIDSAPPPTEMMIDHPEAECRLRTFAAGALCNQPAVAPISDQDPKTAWCEDSELARRPHCWYKRP